MALADKGNPLVLNGYVPECADFINLESELYLWSTVGGVVAAWEWGGGGAAYRLYSLEIAPL